MKLTRHLTQKHIFRDKYYKFITIRSLIIGIPIFSPLPFSAADILHKALAWHVSLNFHNRYHVLQ